MKKRIALLSGLLLATAAFSQESRITVTVAFLGTDYMFREVAGSYMGVTEVTQAQYEAVMGENPRSSPDSAAEKPVPLIFFSF